MYRLVISKIGVLPNYKKYMECQMGDTRFTTYSTYPPQIMFLGDCFVKTGWNSDRGIIHYQQQ